MSITHLDPPESSLASTFLGGMDWTGIRNTGRGWPIQPGRWPDRMIDLVNWADLACAHPDLARTERSLGRCENPGGSGPRSFAAINLKLMKTSAQIAFRPGIIDRISRSFPVTNVQNAAVRITHPEHILYHLQVKAMSLPRHATARSFTPILERAAAVRSQEWAALALDGNGRKVLVDNDHLKVVLIRWEPGAASNKHFHPQGGGMIMVLEGSVQESRYPQCPADAPDMVHVLGPTAMSYIDDSLGAHAVRNPNPFHAVTLHAYLKDRHAGKA